MPNNATTFDLRSRFIVQSQTYRDLSTSLQSLLSKVFGWQTDRHDQNHAASCVFNILCRFSHQWFVIVCLPLELFLNQHHWSLVISWWNK